MRIFRKTYKYGSGNIQIKSDTFLNSKQITLITEIINDVISKGDYNEPCYAISRRIYHEIGVRLRKLL